MTTSSPRRSSVPALILLLALVCLAVPGALAQQQPAGRVTIVLGSVDAIAADGTVRRLERGDPVFQGDTLRTGSRGRGQIRFTDRGMLSLRPDTLLAIDDYAFDDRDAAAGRQQLKLDRGGFRTRTGRIAEANRQAYRVQTPVAVIGVRGTVFDAHQEPDGALLVGVSQGGVEVQSSLGMVGRIGAGESFDFVRVDPDGSVEFLLEAPDVFSVTPAVDDGEAGEQGEASQGAEGFDSDAGDTSPLQATADADPNTGADFVSQVSSPESTSIASPSQTGSGIPPTTTPLDPPVSPPSPPDPDPTPDPTPDPAPAVLSTAQTAALLADDRVGLAIGVQGATTDGEGALQAGPSGLFGGIATFNSPLLALDSSRSGLGAGIVGADRQVLLDDADIFLLPGSAEFTLEEDMGGVPGLIWGRYATPVTVFVDPLDATKFLELDRDLLFVLGTPTEIADLEGVFFYELSAWEAIGSGLPVNAVEASGALDIGTGVYSGFIDVLLGSSESADFSLFAEFVSQVNGGVLEGIELGTFDLFEFATESSSEAEGTLAGFFTGDAASFLQLAFDFRVPSRSDANVRGLALLEQQEPLPDPLLSTAQEDLLLQDDRLALALGVQAGTESSPGELEPGPILLGGGIGALESGSPILALGGGNAAFPAGVATGPRQDLLDAADIFLLPGSAEFTLQVDMGGVPDLIWGRYAKPVTVFVDPLDATKFLELDRDLLFVLGTPTDVADLEGVFFYELSAWDAIGSGLPISGVEASGALDLGTGIYSGSIDVLLGSSESADFSLFAEFVSQVNGGVLEGIEFGTFDLFEFATESSSEAEGTLAGFFTGDAASFLQLALDFRVPARSDADVRGLVLLERNPEILEGALTPAEKALLDGGTVFVAAGCCLSDLDGAPTGTYAGLASDPAPSGGNDTLLSLNLTGTGEAAGPLDPEFVLFPPNVVIRRSEAPAVGAQDYGDGVFGFEWQGQQAPAFAHDAGTGEVIETLGQSLQVLTGIPTPTANLIGSARYELQDFAGFALLSENAGFQPGALTTADVELSFNVDLASGAVSDGLFMAKINLDQASMAEGSAMATLFGFFGGQVALANANPFVGFEILGGGADVFGISDELDLSESDLSGFFTGAGGDRFAAALRFQTMGANQLAEEPTPLLAIGTALLGREELALTTVEAALFGDGLAFVGADCCLAPAVGTGFATVAGAEAVLGVYVDVAGEDLSPLDPLFGSGLPQELLRRAGASTDTGFDNSFFSEVSDATITEVIWLGGLSPALSVSADSGDILDRLDDIVLFHTALPTSVANLQGQGFSTFSGHGGAFDIAPTGTHFGFGSGASTVLGYSASFNVDLATAEIHGGHLFVVDERQQVLVGTEQSFVDLGFEVFFEGRVGVAEGNSFAELEILDGSYHGRAALDLEQSELGGFFAGEQGLVFLGSYGLATAAGAEVGHTAAGIFALSNEIEPELRLFTEDVRGFGRTLADDSRRPTFGMAVFETAVFGEDPTGGVMLGFGSDPNAEAPVTLGANLLRDIDPVSELRIGTRRAGFLAQPFDFVLFEGERQDLFLAGLPFLVERGDVRPDSGSPSFEGFEVSWGAWEAPTEGSGIAASIVGAGPSAVPQDLDRVFVANVQPTPMGALAALTGSFTYAGGDGNPIAFAGMGGSTLLQGDFPLDFLMVRFDLDFTSGEIIDGLLSAAYGSSFGVRWDVTFDGALNGALTDFRVDTVEIFDPSNILIGSALGSAGSTNMTGVLTGPMGERHAGGFSFAVELDQGLGTETLQGLWVIDQALPVVFQ